MQNRRYRALLVGNWHYPEDPANLPDLRGPLNDISRLGAVLSDSHIGMFAEADVNTMTERPSYEIGSSLEAFFVEAERDQVLLFYYSGHGLTDERGSLLLSGRNTRIDRKLSTTVSAAFISDLVDRSPAAATVILLDCCHSGAFKSGNSAANTLAGRGRYVLTSGRPREKAHDALQPTGVSRFTGHILEGLAGKAAHAASTHISMSHLYTYVTQQMSGQGSSRPVRRFDGEGDLAIGRVRSIDPSMLDSDAGSRGTVALSASVIDVGEIAPDDAPLVKKVYVTAHNQGGFPAPWFARTDSQWIGLGPYPDRLEITISQPTSHDRGKAIAAIEIRNRESGETAVVQIIARVPRGASATTESTTALAAEVVASRELSLSDKEKFVDAFLALPGMGDQDIRSLYVQELVAGAPTLVVPRFAEARLDIWSLVNTCLNRPGMLRKFADTAKALLGEGDRVTDLLQLVDRYDSKTVDPPAEPAPTVDPAATFDRHHDETEDGGLLLTPRHGLRRPLADELFLLSHDPDNGKALINHAVLDVAVAGAILGELIINHRIDVREGLVRPVELRSSSDALANRVLETIARQDTSSAGEWLSSLGPGITQLVAQRLAEASLIIPTATRIPGLRRRIRYRAVNALTANDPATHVARHLVGGADEADAQTAMLSGLIKITGLYRNLAVDLSRQKIARRIDDMVGSAPASLQSVLRAVDTAVAAIALSGPGR